MVSELVLWTLARTQLSRILDHVGRETRLLNPQGQEDITHLSLDSQERIRALGSAGLLLWKAYSSLTEDIDLQLSNEEWLKSQGRERWPLFFK